MRAEIKVRGIVQGVGFRPFVYRLATTHALVGLVRNRGDATVEIILEGEKSQIKQFVAELRDKKPPLARIYSLTIRYLIDKDEFDEFSIVKSTEKTEFSGSIIPPDVAICEECLKELKDPTNPRHSYFFITCTDCGPRYTIIERLPYDRPNTTLNNFLMCDLCKREYEDPANRRFHAQTVACPNCGPRAYLTAKNGELIDKKDPIREAGKLLQEGNIIAVKGVGGFHVATSTTNADPIERLRKVKLRSQKPFAIMARDFETVRTFAEVNAEEERVLTSWVRPIVLLSKSGSYFLSDLIAPNLHNIGVMLPYTGLHIMLFDKVKEPAFVMTSANPPNEPIVTENKEALKKLGDLVDYFLFHDRIIAHRCDDSVVRMHGQRLTLIRRSRGYAPEPIQLAKKMKYCSLGVGAEQNATSCILLGEKAFISPYIGDVENIETLQLLKDTVSHMIRLTNSKIEVVVSDLHPKFSTTRLASELGTELSCPQISVQHHHAHIAALLGEHGISRVIGIACDGFGYGTDGQAWGGEILYCEKAGFKRLGHLQEQPMPGADLATRYPARMAAGILCGTEDIADWLLSESSSLPHGKEEAEIILEQLEKRKITSKTTSCGRVLDAISAILGVCKERTYEGEPAMKLESVAKSGKDVLGLEPQLEGDTLNTTFLVKAVFERKNECRNADLAYSAQAYLAKGLAQLAVEHANRLDLENVGFSGGVSYNMQITMMIRKIVEENGLSFFVHEILPAGDGCISFGQALVGSFQRE
ncbi:MAG TPA: carbamoyltransferase HypF [Candidatus Bathyarchaeia archaeon]|nr:carbamoyltransferase HypF [Candidatus Bathyarchaeia archaeon]